MKTLQNTSALRQQIAQWRAAKNSIAFVPTMGNLHDGHLALVKAATLTARRVVVSIFVNPLQFSINEDLSSYPRTLVEDQAKLTEAGVDLLFLPLEKSIYPKPLSEMTQVSVPELSNLLCGRFRPQHFVGVATIVAKLFNLVQPDIALFGEKDFQQLMVIRQMVADLSFNIDIQSVPIFRENDGLAMSSRNAYLTPQERQQAVQIFLCLNQIEAQLQQGQSTYPQLEQTATDTLTQQGFNVDYVSIRSAHDLSPAHQHTALVILIAATLGNTRLIDNRQVNLTQ